MFKSKEEQTQKLVVESQDGSASEIRQPPEAEPKPKESQSQPPAQFQIKTASHLHAGGPHSRGLARHRRIVVSIFAGLMALSIGMGVCIVRDNATNAVLDKAFALLASGKWQESLAVLDGVDDRKINQRYSRDSWLNTAASRMLFPNANTITRHAGDLVDNKKFAEAEEEYKMAMAFEFVPFNMPGYYLESTPWAVTGYAKLLAKLHREKELLGVLNISDAMYGGTNSWDADSSLSAYIAHKKWRISSDTTKQTEYSNAVQRVNDMLSSTSYEDEPIEFVARQREALNIIDEQIRKYPEFAPSWLLRARTNLSNNPRQSIEDLTRLLEMYPDLVQALEMRAEAFEKVRDFRSALRDYDLAQKLLTNAPKLCEAKANLLKELHRYKEAQQALDEAMKFDISNNRYLRAKAELYELMGERGIAINTLKKAVQFYELKKKLNNYSYEDPKVFLELAELLVKDNRLHEALSVLDKASDSSEFSVKELRNKILKLQSQSRS